MVQLEFLGGSSRHGQGGARIDKRFGGRVSARVGVPDHYLNPDETHELNGTYIYVPSADFSFSGSPPTCSIDLYFLYVSRFR
jgi:hypothetical protein